MAFRKPITCKRCKTSGLAWKQEGDGHWVLYVGTRSGNNWTASDTLHVCDPSRLPAPDSSKPPTPEPYAPPAPAPGLNRLRCACGVTLWVNPVDILRVGYPVCSGCQTFFEAHTAA